MQGPIKTFRTDSQNAKILEYLNSGKTLTCLEAIQIGLSHNLKSRISDLNKAGYNIKSKKVKVTGTYIARYSIAMDKNNG